jgi:hypothetical protein
MVFTLPRRDVKEAWQVPPFGVIRQRVRSDQDYPDLGQLIAWDMRWRWTSILVEEQHGGTD